MPTDLAAPPTLLDDPRVAEARRLLHEAAAEQRERLNGPRPADPDRKQSYDDLLARFGEQRGGGLWYPYLGTGAGSGPFVELADGSVKYDMINGIGVHVLGHGHRAWLDAGLDAALADTVMQGVLQQNTDSASITQRLIGLATDGGAPLCHAYLCTSGAMANENSFKLAFQRKARRGTPDKPCPSDRLLAFQGTFCGRTLALSSMSDKPGNRVGLPKALDVDYVPFYDPADPEGSTARAVERLTEHLTRWPGHHAAFKMELVIGEGGFYGGSHAFFMALIEVLKRHEVAVIVDEIQTFSRTTRPFAFQHYGLDAHVDLVNFGKATQLCGTLFTDDFVPQPGLIAQTFTASTHAIRACDALLDQMEEDHWYDGPGADPDHPAGLVAATAEALRARVQALAESHPDRISGPYGVGSMIAFTPFDGSLAAAKWILDDLFERGVIAFLCGRDAVRIRFLPACAVLTDHHLDEVTSLLDASLAAYADQA